MACRSGANPAIESTNPPLNPGGDICLPPYAPQRLQPAQRLAAAPVYVGRRAFMKLMKNEHIHRQSLPGTSKSFQDGTRMLPRASSQGGTRMLPRRSKCPKSLRTAPRRPTRSRQAACRCWICMLPLQKPAPIANMSHHASHWILRRSMSHKMPRDTPKRPPRSLQEASSSPKRHLKAHKKSQRAPTHESKIGIMIYELVTSVPFYDISPGCQRRVARAPKSNIPKSAPAPPSLQF